MVVPYSTSNTAGINFRETFTPPVAGSYNTGQLAPLALGQVADGTDGSKWVYCLAGVGGVTGLGYVVVMDEAFGAIMMSNTTGGIGDKIGVSPVAAAAGDYVWIQVYGTCDDIQVAASCAANVALSSTATAGVIDDAAGTHAITGIVLTTARAASQGNAPGLLNFPTITS